jgi:hypothetical protein
MKENAMKMKLALVLSILVPVVVACGGSATAEPIVITATAMVVTATVPPSPTETPRPPTLTPVPPSPTSSINIGGAWLVQKDFHGDCPRCSFDASEVTTWFIAQEGNQVTVGLLAGFLEGDRLLLTGQETWTTGNTLDPVSYELTVSADGTTITGTFSGTLVGWGICAGGALGPLDECSVSQGTITLTRQ